MSAIEVDDVPFSGAASHRIACLHEVSSKSPRVDIQSIGEHHEQ